MLFQLDDEDSNFTRKIVGNHLSIPLKKTGCLGFQVSPENVGRFKKSMKRIMVSLRYGVHIYIYVYKIYIYI